MTLNDDTICAVATRPGGALGIVRVSGPDAIRLTDSIFKSASGHPLASAAPYTLSFGQIVDADQSTVDEVLISVFRAPHSFTGQDSTEISCHGSAYILEQVCSLLIEAGCRQAGPGEFTERAFLAGKLDLSQAEAVADLIASGNRATHHIAMSQLKGHFSSELSVLREQLLQLTSLLELELDFADHEELEFARHRPRWQSHPRDAETDQHCHRHHRGRAEGHRGDWMRPPVHLTLSPSAWFRRLWSVL